MAYGKDIVSTRKLNDNKKAKLGRNGDTEIRKIDNKKSHVTAWEGSLIDSFGKAGEQYVKDVGAGTINPITGLKEYHDKWYPHSHWKPLVLSTYSDAFDMDEGTAIESIGMMFNEMEDFATSSENSTLGNDYSESGLTEQVETMVEKPDETLALITGGPEAQNELIEEKRRATAWGEQKTYQELAGMEQSEMDEYLLEEFGLEDAAGSITAFETKPFDFIEDTRVLEERQSGLVATRGAGTAREAARSAQAQSGFATQGTVTSSLNQQLKELSQDYTQTQREIDLGYQKSIYDEEQRQVNRLYDDVATIKQFT